MDLLTKTILAIVIIVVVLVGLFYASQKVFPGGTVTQAQAISEISAYMASHNQNAIVNITNVTPSQYAGSWHILVSVINAPTSPCPSYYVYSFDYPKYGFVNRTESLYTSNCTVYGLVNNQSYIIGSYPVAIARSYSLNTSSVLAFVKEHGFNSTIVHATYFNSTFIDGKNYSKVWIVNYSAAGTLESVYSVISQVNGNFITTYNLTH